MKIKNVISIYAVLMLFASTAFAQTSGSCGDNATWTYDTETKTLTISGTGAMSDYNSANAPWWDLRDNIQSVIIESGITHIGDYSFYLYKSLESVTIPEGVTSIGKNVFTTCDNLKSVTIPNSTKSIGEQAFASCYALGIITIPNTVETIGTNAFRYAKYIAYSGNAEGAPWGALTPLNGFIDANTGFVYEDDTKTKLTSYLGEDGDINIPDGVTSIGPRVFHSSDITSVNIPSSVTSIGENAFYRCNGLTSVYIPGSVKVINRAAFECCQGLTSVVLSEGIEQLGDLVFFDCPNLYSISFPQSITTIGKKCIHNSDGSGKDIISCYANPELITFSGSESIRSLILVVPKNYYNKRMELVLNNYVAVTFIATQYATINGITYIVDSDDNASACMPTPDLSADVTINSKITIGNEEYNVKSIYKTCFYGNSKINSVTISEGVTTIGEQAFFECTGLTSLTIPEGVTTIGKQAFYECTGLSSLTIPESIETIGNKAFLFTNIADVYWYATPDNLDCFDKVNLIHVFPEYIEECNQKYGDKYTFVDDIKRMSNNGITIPAQTYTGSALTPVVKDGEKTLVEGEDYTITLPEGGCTNVGEYTVTLTGKKLYYKSAEKTFTITAKTLVSSNIADIAALTYTGSAFEPEVTVTDGTKTLVEGTDYTVEYSNNTNAGTSAMVTIKGKGNYTGTAEKAFTINSKTLTANNVSNLAAQTYTGSAFEPEVSVTDGTKSLVEGTDYTVEYSNNTNAGTSAKATITGKGNYTGTFEKTFTINAKTLVASNVSNIAAQTYTGSAIEPDIDVTDGKTTLVKGVDFTVTCSDNINVGTATAIITGKGNYAGTIEKAFTIIQATPTYTIPENLSLKCNQTLADITLPKGLVFDDIKAALTLGKTITVTATFTPEDTKNYVVVKNIDIKVAVTDHVHADAVKENEVAATTENAGKYDEVVYCSVCHKELSRTPKTTPQLTHDNPNNQDNPSTPVSSISDNPVVKVWSFNHTIYIETLPDTEYKIIDLNGRVITTSKTKSTNEQIKINKSGILIVIIDNQSFKLSL